MQIKTGEEQTKTGDEEQTKPREKRRPSEFLPPGWLPECGFVREKQILQCIPIGSSKWKAGVRNGIYPKPVKLGPKSNAWRVGDIKRLIAKLEGE
jgi:predicted DNA-binding transcriptional regulator AlpA